MWESPETLARARTLMLLRQDFRLRKLHGFVRGVHVDEAYVAKTYRETIARSVTSGNRNEGGGQKFCVICEAPKNGHNKTVLVTQSSGSATQILIEFVLGEGCADFRNRK